MFEILGLNPLIEQAYMALLKAGPLSPGALAVRLEMSPDEAAAVADGLIGKGLATRVLDAEETLVAVPPEIALGALMADTERALLGARVTMGEMEKNFSEASRTRVAPAQVITGREAVSLRYLQMVEDAERQVVEFDKPPYGTQREDCNSAEARALARGVKVRVVYDADAFERPEAAADIQAMVRRGEQSRVHPSIPMKLAIADSQVGLIPLTAGESGVEEALLLHSSALLHALIYLFDFVWSKAAPVMNADFNARLESERHAEEPRRIDGQLIQLLGAGLKDETIARQLGVSVRTVERKVAELLETLNARTRFQAGLEVGRRGTTGSS